MGSSVVEGDQSDSQADEPVGRSQSYESVAVITGHTDQPDRTRFIKPGMYDSSHCNAVKSVLFYVREALKLVCEILDHLISAAL